MDKRISYFIMGMLCCLCRDTYCDVIGSDTMVSLLATYTFPVKPTKPNRIASFGLVENGFTLQSSATSLIFDSVFPVSGPIALNGGTLILTRDLIFANPASLLSWGNVTGNNQTISLSPSMSSISTTAVTFQDTKLILNNDVTFSSVTTFSGNCSIEGNGYKLTLGSIGAINIFGQLLLHDVVLDGVVGGNVKCLNDNALLILDQTTWIQKGNYTFSTGAFQCRNEVIFRGAATFTYQTLKTSVINADASLLLDSGFTFNYDPIRLASKALFAFVDATSLLILNGATLHTTTTGLNLTKGSMIVGGDSVLSSDLQTTGSIIVDNGITLGDGLQASSDFACNITTGAHLRLDTGSLNYKNLLSSSWLMESSLSTLNLGAYTTLRLYDTLNLGFGIALCDDNVTIARASNAQLLGNVSAGNNLVFTQI
ncbi:MAG: hypothetical protein P4L31_02830 [Candidatus Babeliales bacterium]|nr:hypothetical protein [Candidatus Babeliales bacterium]